MPAEKPLLVISHYQPRAKEPLEALIRSVSQAGGDLVVVVNDDTAQEVRHDTWHSGVRCITRPNTGMNIGGWDCAWREFPGYQTYIFIQDECVLQRPDFVTSYQARLAEPGLGMIGESINPKWDREWQAIARTGLNYAVGTNEQGRVVTRIDYYLHCMHRWGVTPGSSGRHLRALVWAFNAQALSVLGGFPVGTWKEECIAAEIAVSKAVEQRGLRVEQVHTEPFRYFRHSEWRPDGYAKIGTPTV